MKNLKIAKTIKTVKTQLMVLLAVILFSIPAIAQERQHDPEERAKKQTEKMKTELALHDDQVKRIEQLNADRANQVQTLKVESQKERAERKEKMQKIHQEWESNVENVLTADQKAKYESLKEGRKEKMKTRRGKGTHKSKKRMHR